MSSHAAGNLANMPGTLYVVATPIGNLADLSRRAADVLGCVAMIAAEDTRRTRVLLDHLAIAAVPLLALHSHNETAASTAVVERLLQGDDVALVTDAGTPLLSDPGFELVRACWDSGVTVLPLPGASAVATVLSVCPLPAARFLFEGFLPAKSGARAQRLAELLRLGVAVVFFEAPHRMAETLSALETLAPDRRVLIGREMTKRHEQYLCDRPAALRERLGAADQFKGEFVCVLEGGEPGGPALDVQATMAVLCRELPPAQAARLGAQLLGRHRRELYDLALSLRSG
jgi:16S rRNA (cytidine1402-2'-O)-methyltransferase